MILDWLHENADYSANTKKMMELDEVAYNLITPSEYLETVKKFKIPIETKYGNDIYEYCIESWGYQRDAFNSQELITGIISAKKHLEG